MRIGEKWHKRRRILTPAFHFNVLQKYAIIIIENSTKMIDSLKSLKKDSTQSLVSFTAKHTLDVICGN